MHPARAEKLYLVPENAFTSEQLVSWYINHLGHTFSYCSERKRFIPSCSVVTEGQHLFNPCLCPLVTVASALPFKHVGHDSATIIYDPETDVRCLRLEQNHVVVIDCSFSTLNADAGGKCYLNDSLNVLEVILRQLIGARTASLPGTQFRLRTLSPLVTIIAVIPSVRCYTLLSGWSVNISELQEKLRHIFRLLIKIERELIHFCSAETKPIPKSNNLPSNSLTDLLKHGIMAASSLAPNNEPCSMLIITDGCLSISDVEILDRSLTHLRSEGIRCSFFILNKTSSLSTLITPGSVEGSALRYVTNMNICLPQIDLCTLLAYSTNGFCFNTEGDELLSQSYGSWNDLLELLISVPLLFKHDVLDGNLHWVPAGTLETQRRKVRASVPTVLFTRLRDGYKLRTVRILRDANVSVRRDPECSFTNVGSEAQLGDPNRAIRCSGSLIHLELTMLWKVGITFSLHIRGLWPDVYQTTETDKAILGLNDGPIDGSFSLRVRNRSKPNDWTNNFHTCQISFSISANYSFLHEVTCKKKLPIHNIHRASTISRFVMYHRHLSVTDQQIEHVFKFWGIDAVSKGPEQLPSGLSSVFTLIPDSTGKQVVVPSLLAHRLSASLDGTVSIATTKSQFFRFWRLFIERDLLEFYRWLQIRNIYGILEHDSPLPVCLHLPPERERYTASVACRQSLDRLHAFLSRWSSFTLLEGTVYVRLLSIDDDESVHISGCISDSSVLREAPPSSDAADGSFTGAGAHGSQSDRSLFFCVVRVELNIPEFRLRVGFVIGTPPPIQEEIMLQLREQIIALRFPPRGRQAIPRSRHKSGAPLTNNEWTSVPPLQRSWEDTPCCNIFHNRLERLIVNTGVWTRRLFTGYRSSLSKGYLSGDMHIETNTTERLTEQFENSYSLGRAFRPGLELYLLCQHLHHDSKIWVIQPPAFSNDALRLLFSSLLNLRLQEGFHLVRTGPQTGFVSLATEVMLSCPSKGKRMPCLVQYQLYPLGDARLSDTDAVITSSLSTVDMDLKKAITRLITEQKQACASPDSTFQSIFDLTRDTDHSLTLPFRFVQVATEIWIQPMEGRVVPCLAETQNWGGASFTELAQRIFDVDRRCVVAYGTLERLGALLRSPISTQQTINTGTGASTVHVNLDSLLGSLAPKASVEWTRTCLPNLTALSPCMVLIYSFLHNFQNTEQKNCPSVQNDTLLSHFCASLLQNHGTREIHMTLEDSNEYTLHLCEHLGVDQSQLMPSTTDELLQWRCFVMPGSPDSDRELEFIFSSDFNSNPMVTLVFLPKSSKDASSEILIQTLKRASSLHLSSVDTPYLPVFLYSCSRLYLSYLIDDRWTYKPPPVFCFNLKCDISKQSESHSVQSEGSPPVAIVELPPENFLSAGRQNVRLTQELTSLWTNLTQTVHLLSRVHLDSFVSSVYHCLNSRYVVSKTDLDYVLFNTQMLAFSQPLYLDITPFLLLTCEHWLAALRQWLHSSCCDGNPSLGNALLMTLLGRETGLLEADATLQIPISVESEETRFICSCWMTRYDRFRNLMNNYMTKLFEQDGLYVLSRESKVKSDDVQPPSGSQCLDRVNISDALPESMPKADLTNSVDSDNSADSQSYLRAPTGNLRQRAVDTRRKHGTDLMETDFLVRTINQWFLTDSESGQERPLFVQISGILSYGSRSVSVPLVDGLPVLCFSQMKDLFTDLVDQSFANEKPFDHLSINLSMLRFEIKLSLLYWPHYSDRELLSRSNEPQLGTERAASTGFTDKYITPLIMEDAANAVFSWSMQSQLSPLSGHQKAVVCLFACHLAWQMANDIVCGLHGLSPILVPSIEFVLRHIEDTEKLGLTPLFQECCLIAVNDSVTCTGFGDSLNSAKDKVQSHSEGFSETQCKSLTISSIADFYELSEMIKVERIRLDLVSFSPEIISYFTRQFEKICFSPVHAHLEYIGGYYYLRSMDIRVTPTEPGSSSYQPSTDISITERRSATEKSLKSPSCSLSETILSHRPSRPAYSFLSRASFELENDMWLEVKNPNAKYFPNRYSSPDTHFASNKNGHLRNQRIHSDVPSTLVYGRDSSDLGDGCEDGDAGSCPAKISYPRQENVNKMFPMEPILKKPCEPCSKELRTPIVEQYKTPPYWLLFRVCSNSVSLFFHHSSGLHTRSHGPFMGHPNDLSRDPTKPYLSPSIPTFACEHCDAFQFAIKSIHSVIRLVNQRILLNKLRNERKCDPLLLEISNDGLSRQQVPPPRRAFRSLTNDKHLKHSSVSRYIDEQSPVSSTKTHLVQKTRHIDNSSMEQSDVELQGPASSRHSQKKIDVNMASSIPHRTSLRSNGCPSGNWPPGYFACPVQMVNYLRLHPRILAATAHVGQVDRDRRIVAALRCLLEKPAIAERSDMFFLIDRPPQGVSTEPKTNFTSQTTPTANSVGSLDDVPVFYMILKEGTAQSFKADSVGANPSILADTCMLLNDQQKSEADDSKSIRKPVSDTRPLINSTQSTYPSLHSRSTSDLLLQITLHGIDTPSRHLCSFVRRMLQQLLDDLILQHFSDSLSRNAINRLSIDDLNFLSKSPAPQRECLIALPRFISCPAILSPNVAYGSEQLTLAFCHYLKQNLLLFLTPVKLDRSESSSEGHEIIELFLYNRPRAQGVAKPGVATLSFRLFSSRSDNQVASDLHPYVITDWTLPYEHNSNLNGFEPPTLEALGEAIQDVCELHPVESLGSDQFGEMRLVLSVHMWQRGDADMTGLQQRIQTAVSHSLYDLITEFFVLTSPIKFHGTVVDKSQMTNCSNGVAREASLPVRMNPYLITVVLPWFRQGRLLDSPLVTKTEVNLSYGILLDQFIVDFLRPFSSNLNATHVMFDSGESVPVSTKQVPNVNLISSATGATLTEYFPKGVFFYTFAKQHMQTASSYWLKQYNRFSTSASGPPSRPGVTQDYLLVGRNFTAWRRLLRRVEQVASGSKAVDRKDGGIDEAIVGRSRSDRLIGPVLDFDVLLRMQPLQVTLLVPLKTTTPHSLDTCTPVVDQPTNRSSLDETSASSRTQTANAVNWSSAMSVSGFGPELSTSGTPAACRFPEFCPIKLAHLPNTLQPAILAPIALSPRVSTVTSPTGSLQQAQPQQQQRQAPQQQPPVTVAPNSGDIPSTSINNEKVIPITVQVPRQALCLLQLTGRCVTLLTYNWSKEEADRLSYRLTSLADWYNRRLELLKTLSTQKLGLFHDLDDPLVRWCAGHAGELISSQCPPELLCYPDSVLTGAASRGLQATPTNSVGLGPQNTGPTSGLRVYASGGATAGGSVAGGGSGSNTRRRHPTSSGDSVPVLSTNYPSHTASPTTPLLQNTTFLAEVNSHKTVVNFLRLFQDCSRIPPLKHPSDSELSMDLVFRHGLQAITTVDFDRRRAQRLELVTLPFRAWQESRKRRLAGETIGMEKLAPKKTTTSTEVASRPGAQRKLGFGISEAETTLANEPMNKQLKRFSAIRQACRQLHTICTPILFCPQVRAQAVQLTQSELCVLSRVAEACYQWHRESMQSTLEDDGLVGQQPSKKDSSTSKTSVSSADQPSSSKLRELLLNQRTPASGLHRVQSCIFGSTRNGTAHSSAYPSRMSLTGLHHSASPWLNWSSSTLFDELPGLQASDTLGLACDSWLSDVDHSPSTDTSLSSSWERRICSAFLTQYAQYVQTEVGFRSVLVVNSSGSRSSGNNAHTGQTMSRNACGSYALFHRAIHLAGVHIMEVFIRNGHMYVLLGTIELSRFSRHASRALISGPFTAEVITQAAASAAASVASVMRDAASGMPDAQSHVIESRQSSAAQASPNLSLTSTASNGPRFERTQYASGFSWDESSRLCDYMHINSFSYDYYLRVVQDYLSHQQIRRKQSSEAVRRSIYGRSHRSSYTGLLGFPDYPVTDFLADLYYLSPNPPVYSRGCLRSFPLSCPVSACLRPDQVFHHLIEEHPNYSIQIIRMDRTARGLEPGLETPKVNPSYTFAILVQHLVEPTQSTPGSRPSLTRQSSHPELKGNRFKPALLQSKSLIPTQMHHGSSVTTQDADRCANQQQDKGRVSAEEMFGAWFPSLPCSATACVVVDERNANALLRQTPPGPVTGSRLNLNVYLFVTDPNNMFPKSRLTSLQERPYSQSPVEWPAVAPCLRLDAPRPGQPTRIVPRSCSIEDAEALAVLNVSFSGLCRSRRVSFIQTAQATKKRTTHDTYVPLRGDLRWQVSYLGMWPSHQLRMQQSIESAQSAIESRITTLISRSGLDCHKNLLWYRLFDMHHHLDALKSTERSSSGEQANPDVMPAANKDCQQLAGQYILSMKEIEDLVQSAPFQLDVLTLDDRLRETVKVGARYFSQVRDLMNAEFVRNQQQQQPQTSDAATQVVIQPVAFTFMFHQTPPSVSDLAPTWSTHHMVLLSPTFTEGFILLSWSQRFAVCVRPQGLPGGFCNHQPQQNYRDFQLRAVFRTAGDPMNPGSMRRLLDSGHQIQGLFFERSPLAALVTSFVETLNFCIWRGLHGN